MPRSLARLRYKAPPAPINFSRIDGARPLLDSVLEKRVAAYVVRQSNPRHVKLQVVVNQKAKQQPTGKFVPPPIKPYTLRDIVDPEGTARHGEIIYIFRNIKTNQIIYSLQALLDKHHLEQLPFIGKHSKPPVLRPDEWAPHCVITFPTPEQGQNAFRKLREFRKLHELAWDKTNPEYRKMKLKDRMKKIMDQRANTSADLAEVLRIQDEHGAQMAEALEAQQKKAKEFLVNRWEQIDALSKAAEVKEKDADNIKWLEHQINSVGFKLKMKHNQNEADQKRLKAAHDSLKIRLRKIKYALRKADQRTKIQEDLSQKAAPANVLGAEGKLHELQDQAKVLQEAVENPDPTRSEEDRASDLATLSQLTADISTLEKGFEAKAQLESNDHYIHRSVLPGALKNPLPLPYTLDGVSVRWADLQDALYASGNWPEAIDHESLSINRAQGSVAMLSAEDFQIETNKEVSQILSTLRPGYESFAASQVYVPAEVGQQKKTGMWARVKDHFTSPE